MGLSGSVPLAKAVGGLQQANGAYYSNPWGTKANIETANPQIRAGGYQFSWVRTTVQYEPGGGTNNYVEIGWYKDGGSGTISVTVVSDLNGIHFQQSYNIHPTPGSSHSYELLWNTSNSGYDARYDGVLVVNRPGPLSLTRVFCGGETGDSINAIGVSGCLSNQYANTSSGSWPRLTISGRTYA